MQLPVLLQRSLAVFSRRGLVVAVLLLAAPSGAVAQVDYSGGVYTQDFDTLRSGAIYTPYTNLPTGWILQAMYGANTYVWSPVTNGFSNNYGRYCFSLEAADPDKAIGLLIGSTGAAYLGARFRNQTGVTLTSFTLRYAVEQWRKGATLNQDQVIPFSFSLNAVNLTSGTYTAVPALDMHSIHDGDGTAAALNGHLPTNRQQVESTVTGISWRPGHDLWIRWSGVSYPFLSAHALALDNLSFQAVPELRLASTGAGWRLLWSTNHTDWALHFSISLSNQDWETVTNSPVILGSEYCVEVDGEAPQGFFRLQAK